MLDKNDLQAISELFHTEIAASEQRMTAKMEGVATKETLRTEIAASEERMTAKMEEMATKEMLRTEIAASEQRMTAKIREAATEAMHEAVSQSIAYMENTLERKLDLIRTLEKIRFQILTQDQAS